jgi:hypothetical protein
MTRPASPGLRIPFSPARAPSTDPSSNSPCETVRVARGCGTVQLDCVLPERLGASYVPSRRLPILYALTGKLRRESRLELMMGTGTGQKVAEMDPDVAQALQKLAKTLPSGFSVDEAKLTRRAEEYENARGTSRARKRYPLVGDLYDTLIDLSADQAKQDKFVRKLRKQQTIEWGADLSSLIAQYYMKRSEKRIRRYAYALCGAALKGIPASGLATALEKNGISVDVLATQFTGRRKKPVRKPLTLRTIELCCSNQVMDTLKGLSEPNLRFFVDRQGNQLRVRLITPVKQKSKGN